MNTVSLMNYTMKDCWSSIKTNWNKTGLINDPFGQPTVPPAVKICFVLVDIEKLGGRTDNMCEYSDHYRPGLWSASWINYAMKDFETLKSLSMSSILTVVIWFRPEWPVYFRLWHALALGYCSGLGRGSYRRWSSQRGAPRRTRCPTWAWTNRQQDSQGPSNELVTFLKSMNSFSLL